MVISRKIASQHRGAEGRPKKVGDSLRIGAKSFEIVGMYETGSMILDVVVIMDIDMAREVLNEPKDSVSCIYVEGKDPEDQRGVVGRDREASLRGRCTEHERGPGQLRLADGAGQHLLAHDRQPGSAWSASSAS